MEGQNQRKPIQQGIPLFQMGSTCSMRDVSSILKLPSTTVDHICASLSLGLPAGFKIFKPLMKVTIKKD